MKTVDELISEWTEEEREKLRDLIDECRDRERQLMEHTASCQENLVKLTESLSFLFSNLYSLERETKKLENSFLGTYLSWDYKKSLPS